VAGCGLSHASTSADSRGFSASGIGVHAADPLMKPLPVTLTMTPARIDHGTVRLDYVLKLSVSLLSDLSSFVLLTSSFDLS
jgi:hypothetical protein